MNEKPLLRRYQAGSIIYFEGDKGEEIYILQEGKVVLTYKALDFQTELKESVRKGEFFGVKSAIGRYPREETAQAITQANVLVFSIKLFENFCLKNPQITLKMLKVFSSHLRKVHQKVREILGEKAEFDSSVELAKVGEYYYKAGKKEYALYAFKAFLKYYPHSPLRNRVERMLDRLKRGEPYPLGASSIEEELASITPTEEKSSFGEEDFSPSSFSSNPLGEELPPPPLEEEKKEENITEYYYQALNASAQGNYDLAEELLLKALSIRHFSSSEEASLLEKSLFELGKVYRKKNEIKKAVESFHKFIKKYPQSPLLKKALFQLAEIYEKAGNKRNALLFYKKVAETPPRDRDSNLARTRMENLMRK